MRQACGAQESRDGLEFSAVSGLLQGTSHPCSSKQPCRYISSLGGSCLEGLNPCARRGDVHAHYQRPSSNISGDLGSSSI